MNSKLVCFEKEGDGRCCSVLANNPLATVLVLVSLYFSSDEDLRGNTAKLVAREVRVTDFAQTRAAHCSVERRLRRLEGRDLTTKLPLCIQFGLSGG